jgi:ribosomal protein L24, bacterial/organelle
MKTSNNKVHVKRDDTVIVISGDDKGKRGKVVEVSPKEGKIIVSGVHVVSKHTKPRKQGDAGGIIKVDGPIYADKVMPYCSKCSKGVRVKHTVNKDNKKIRVCAKCGAEL